MRLTCFFFVNYEQGKLPDCLRKTSNFSWLKRGHECALVHVRRLYSQSDRAGGGQRQSALLSVHDPGRLRAIGSRKRDFQGSGDRHSRDGGEVRAADKSRRIRPNLASIERS